MKKQILLFIAVFSMIAFTFSGCKKNKDENPPVVKGVTTLKVNYYALEIAQLKATGINLGTETLSGTFNGTAVDIFVDDSLAAFVVPDVAVGTYSLSFSKDGENLAATIVVTATTNIQTPDFYLQDIISYTTGQISFLNSQADSLPDVIQASAIQSDISKMTAQLNDFNTRYQALSITDKENFARIMAANRDLILEIRASIDSLQSKMLVMPRSFFQDREMIWGDAATRFGFQFALTLAHLPVFKAAVTLAFATSTTGIGVVVFGVGAAAIAISFFDEAYATTIAGERLFHTSLKAFNNLSVAEVTYIANQETQITPRANYRSLYVGDISNQANYVIKTIANGWKFYVMGYNGLVNWLNSIPLLPAFAKPDRTLTPIENETNYNTVVRTIHNNNVHIIESSSTNPNVIVHGYKYADGSTGIKVTTTATTIQNFDYKIEYTNNGFTDVFTGTVSATVDPTACSPIDSTQIYEAGCVGNWTVNGLPTGASYQLVLYANGTGRYICNDANPINCANYSGIDNGIAYYNVTWSVEKINCKYFLRENGFYHPGYEQYRVFDVSLPNIYLPYPVSSFKTYTDFGQGPTADRMYSK